MSTKSLQEFKLDFGLFDQDDNVENIDDISQTDIMMLCDEKEQITFPIGTMSTS
jgi:hypothetical protein